MLGFNLPTFLMLLGVLIAYTLLSKVTGVTVIDVVEAASRVSKKLFDKSTSSLENSNRKDFQTFSLEERRKSKKYRWYAFSTSLISDLGLDGQKLSPEYLFMLTVIFSFLGVILLSKLISNIIVQTLLFVTIDVWIFAILYLISRRRGRKRYKALMKAEDLICQNISENPAITLRDVSTQVDPIIAAPFKKFVVSYFTVNQPFNEAITEFNLAMGPSFNDVCQKMQTLHESGRHGMVDTFKDNIDRNATAREMDIQKERIHSALNSEFLACLALLILIFFYTYFSYDAIANFYKSVGGQLVIILYLAITLGVLCFTQYVQSKGYD